MIVNKCRHGVKKFSADNALNNEKSLEEALSTANMEKYAIALSYQNPYNVFLLVPDYRRAETRSGIRN